jgi:hypothetical protein
MEDVTWHAENTLVYYGRLMLRNGLLMTAFGLVLFAILGGAGLPVRTWIAIILVADALVTALLSYTLQPRTVGITASELLLRRGLHFQRIPLANAWLLVNTSRIHRMLSGWIVAYTEASESRVLAFLNGSSVDFLLNDSRLEKRDAATERERARRAVESKGPRGR